MPLTTSVRLDAVLGEAELVGVPHVGGEQPAAMANLLPGGQAVNAQHAKVAGFKADKAGSSLLFGLDGGPVQVALGTGKLPEPSLEDWRLLGAALVRSAGNADSAALLLPRAVEPEVVEAVATGALLASYRFEEQRSTAKASGPAEVVLIADPEANARALDRARAAAEQVAWARDMVNTPPSQLPPRELAARAAAMLEPLPGVAVEVWERPRIEAERLGGLLGVAVGSDEDPRLVRATWSPAAASKHVVLVGKGITFDTGGLSLKPATGMVTMKTDMSGAAIVLATLGLVARLDLPIKVTAIAPMAENMPSGRATKPDDVLVTRDGQTIEVLNTDAEGRLILSDGLTLARELEPDAILDVATLTGAVSVALGREIAAVMGTSEQLVADVIAAGEQVGERYWELPLPDIYESHIESEVADMKNIGKAGEAGTISAALLLKRFVGDVPWAHLDIAGTGRSESNAGYLAKGGTAFSLRTFAALLEQLAR